MTASSSAPASHQRVHHFDALRGLAMLLGIALHAVLSFTDMPWIVKDNFTASWCRNFFEVIHGFRMQLFFLVSGYFTMLLWRRRGLVPLLEQRYHRVFVPCMIGLVTIVPLLELASVWAVNHAPTAAPTTKSALVEAIRANNPPEVARLLAAGSDPNQVDPEFKMPPIAWAAFYGDTRSATLLLEQGANVNQSHGGYRPLHDAAFVGQHEIVKLFLARGADLDARGPANDTARDSTKADWQTTKFLTGLLRIPLGSEEEVRSGREKCLAHFDQHEQAASGPQATIKAMDADVTEARKAYRDFITSPRWNVRHKVEGPPFHLVLAAPFAHLWFLWFLCWLLVLFGLAAKVVEFVPIPRLPAGLVLSRLRLLWLVPVTVVPQLFMGVFFPTFGPDTSLGIIPQPHILLYYGLFFAFGLVYHDANDQAGRLGRWWWLWLAIAGAIYVPASEAVGQGVVSSVLQVLYTWSAIFGLIGLCRIVLGREYRVVRYLSDSAYWLYLAHLPLVVFVQAWVRELEYPVFVKFSGVCVGVTLILLVSYQLLIRPTYIGTILNGRRVGWRRTPRAEG